MNERQGVHSYVSSRALLTVDRRKTDRHFVTLRPGDLCSLRMLDSAACHVGDM